MIKNPLILAIDTSCDDTSVALTLKNQVISNFIASQTQIHQPFGGVFPTLAKQAHQKNLPVLINAILKKNHLSFNQIQALAVTYGPGLAPALEVGLNYIKTIHQEFPHLKILAVNHLQAHLLAVLASNNTDKSQEKLINLKNLLPALGLIVSGGHSCFVKIQNPTQFYLLGETLDDACGECLDKVGRLLSLGYPAGHIIENLAKKGNAKKFSFPLPMTNQKNFNLSFSGLKTFSKNLINQLEKENKLDQKTITDFCASFQHSCFNHLIYKLKKILLTQQFQSLWLGGGVASNIYLRKLLRSTLKTYKQKKITNVKLLTPINKKLCTDNAAMIGVASYFLWQIAKFSNIEKLDRNPCLKIEK